MSQKTFVVKFERNEIFAPTKDFPEIVRRKASEAIAAGPSVDADDRSAFYGCVIQMPEELLVNPDAGVCLYHLLLDATMRDRAEIAKNLAA